MLIRLRDQKTAKKLLKLLRKARMTELADDVAAEMAFDNDKTTDPDRQKLIDAASDEYAEEGDREITIDSDALISESDEHAFVMAWVYVPYADAGIKVEGVEDDDVNISA